MRRFLLTYICLSILGLWSVQAQQMQNQFETNRDRFGNPIDPSTQPDKLDSANVEIQSLPPKVYMWRLSETLGERTIVPADTIHHHFQNSNFVEGVTGHYNYLGNLGSPRLSRLFFERRENDPTIFMEPFSSFYVRPDEVYFTNSNIPYSNLTYYKGGSKVNGEERFKSYFSVNVNKELAFGFNFDYLYGRGYYSNQSTSYLNAGVFGSYIGERYQIQAVYNNFNMKMNENGGIVNDGYITNPENMGEGQSSYLSTNIPVNFEKTTNRNKDFYVYMNQRYRLGFQEEKQIIQESKNDTTTTIEFVPVTSFIHTFKVERSRHQFRAQEEPENFYENTYLFRRKNTENPYSRDSTTAISVKNIFGVSLLEGFNKYAKAGLTAYVSHKYSRYELMDSLTREQQQIINESITDTTLIPPRARYTEQEIYVGGELSKRQGNFLHYTINGEVGVLKEALGQFRVHGDMDLNFRLWKDTINFIARGAISNTLPSFYMRHYHSNHFFWDNEDMEKEFRTRIEGELNIDRWGTNLRAGIENIKNYTYFNQHALPTQHDDNIQIVSATLTQNFQLGIFHLDNEVTWQKSSNEAIVPLPELSLYHNFYIQTKLAKKVLSVQLGADVRYFSKYYAPAYTPAIQQFHLQSSQDQVEIGGYPVVNIYANLHLKRTRMFAMMYHVNQGMGNRNYFYTPHYPINPRIFKIGISWKFYD